MKHQAGLLLAFLFIATLATAQNLPPINQHPVPKPALFAAVPNQFAVSSAVLHQLFLKEKNATVSARLHTSLAIEGYVLEKTMVTNLQLSINIRCTNYNNALLNISQLTQADGSIVYTGRLVNPASGDLLLLQAINGGYAFIKQQQLHTMVD
jgi:hypothetical protein